MESKVPASKEHPDDTDLADYVEPDDTPVEAVPVPDDLVQDVSIITIMEN